MLRNCMIFLFTLFVSNFDSLAYGDLLILKTDSGPISEVSLSGRLIQRTPEKVLFRIRANSGETVNRWYERSRIELILVTCDQPKKGMAIQDRISFAERLCAMKKDWEARYTGLSILKKALAETKDPKTQLHIRWVLVRYSLSNKQAEEEVAAGVLHIGARFTDRLKFSCRLPFPDRIDKKTAQKWIDAIRSIRNRNETEGRKLLKTLSGRHWTKDCNQFAMTVAGSSDRLSDPKVQLRLLGYELQFERFLQAESL